MSNGPATRNPPGFAANAGCSTDHPNADARERTMFKVPEKFRLKTGPTRSDSSYGNNGHFVVRSLKFTKALFCQASDGAGWEHVSVSLPGYSRCPTWEEMSLIKSLFWGEDDLVVQFHPPKEDHINTHPYCLHLWRKIGTNEFCSRPDAGLVGLKTKTGN